MPPLPPSPEGRDQLHPPQEQERPDGPTDFARDFLEPSNGFARVPNQKSWQGGWPLTGQLPNLGVARADPRPLFEETPYGRRDLDDHSCLSGIMQPSAVEPERGSEVRAIVDDLPGELRWRGMRKDEELV